MLGRALLTVSGRRAAAINSGIQSRGGALVGWTRPKIEEYGIPKEPWGPAAAKKNMDYNIRLAAGIIFLGLTLTAGKVLNSFPLNTTPWDLVYSVKGSDPNVTAECTCE
jgi:hypothetical protein